MYNWFSQHEMCFLDGMNYQISNAIRIAEFVHASKTNNVNFYFNVNTLDLSYFLKIGNFILLTVVLKSLKLNV